MMPNVNHNNVPNVNNEYIDNEMPFVSFVLMVCSACGKKESVVQNAAINPTMVVLLNIIDGYIEKKNHHPQL